MRAVGVAAGVVLSLTVTASPLMAQAETKTADGTERFPGEKQWKTFFKQGNAAFDEGRYDQAKSLFLKAAAIKTTSKILGNLAQAEVQLREYKAAATHAAEAIATSPVSIGAEEELAAALKHVGKWNIAVNVDGATVKVDAEELKVAGKSKVLFTDPGAHRITVSKAGYRPEEREVAAEKGVEQSLSFELIAESSAPPLAGVVVPPPVTTNEPPPLVLTKPFDEQRDARSGPSPIILIAGGAVAVGGLVTGLVFNATANSKNDDAESIRGKLPQGECAAPSSTGTRADCALLQGALEDKDRDKNISTAGFVVGGAALVGTAVYWLWPRNKITVSTGRELRWTASVSPRESWIGLAKGF